MSAFVSLKTTTPQSIPADTWTILAFDGESTDAPGWHDSGSGLIVPDIKAVALLTAMVQWAPPEPVVGSYVAVQFARDPFGAIDTTGTDRRAVTGGPDYVTTSWSFTVREGQPLAVRVKTDWPRVVTLAEFKVWVP